MKTWAKWVGKRRLAHIGLMVALTCCILFVAFSAASGAQPMVAAGAYHTVGLRSDGTVVAAGWSEYGQLDVGSWTDIIQVAAGVFYTVGLRSDGTAVAVGSNYFGELNVGDWTDIIQVASGGIHTVGLRSDGTAVAVGNNEYGQCNVYDWDLGVGEFSIFADIKPSSFPNSINPKSKGKIPVAILTTDSFDATTVDPTKVLFGATGTEAASVHSALEDVDGDGDTDMIFHFKTQKTGIQCGDTSASLTGETFGGQAIAGADSIRTVGCKSK